MPLAHVKISTERQGANAIYNADWLPIDVHFDQSVSANGDFLEKPEGATHLQLQTISAAIRYTVDESVASVTHGFQLAQGVISTIPCPLDGISVFREGATTIQGQWIR